MGYNKDTGNRGEQIAAEYLQEHGYTLLERNWRYRHWEVDIIASKGKFLLFFEIKTRTSTMYGMPEAAIGRKKMDDLKKAAEEYLYRNSQWRFIRFDVISIMLSGESVKEIFVIEDFY